jgi:TRAP-type C4-dicarboxylate transport system substrate-binding protein
MKCKRIRGGIVFICLVLFFLSLTSLSAFSEEKKLPGIMLKYQASGGPKGVWDTNITQKVSASLENATNGRAKVKNYYSNSLVKGKDRYRALEQGIVDFTFIVPSYTPGVFPLFDLFMLPGLFPNIATSNAVLNVLFDKYPQFEQQFSPKVKPIVSYFNLRNDLHTRMPIRTLEDIKGKKIGTYSPKLAKALQFLGARTSLIGAAELFPALERKIVDGAIAGWSAVRIYRYYELTHYHTMIGLAPVLSCFTFHRDTWNKFTPDEQKKLEMLAPQLQNITNRGHATIRLGVLDKYIYPDKKHEIIEWSKEDLDSMREIFRPMWNEWAKGVEAKGYPGKEMLREAERLIKAYNQT